MFSLRRILTLALASVACARALDVRQAANTNPSISTIVDHLDETMRHAGPTILTLMANQTLSDATLQNQMNTIGAAFKNVTTGLAATPVSSGSTTVMPTDDDIAITYSDAMQLVSASLSGIVRNGKAPSFPAMVATLDPIMAAAAKQFNTTLPNSLSLVAIMLRDAGQFLIAEGFNQTFAAIGPITAPTT
ncbi:hypothetical protein B0H17DRAFT_1204898 [Mycena rosella]|uniref:Uncharacterized protein n=1 Tax=Mycena rosella TaxID=1033263 RepID=A0AAD7GFG1_MYCRO|nr:hypothetical protein B0H17DRAFT_1204898 [Mycena rosella]